MSEHYAPRHSGTTRRWSGRTIAAAAFAIAGLSLTGVGVYAGLTADATNTTAQSVTSGTLKLTMPGETGAASFTGDVANLAPGDTTNRYIALTNGGTLDGKSLGLKVVDATGSVLSSSSTKGLSITVTRCSTAYVPTTGTCTLGTETAYLTKTSLSALGSRTAFAGPVNPAAGATMSLKVSVTLDGTENVVNGSLPVGTTQGLTAALTYTFSEDQRDGVTTNS